MKYTVEIPCTGTCNVLEVLRVEVDAETPEAAIAWAKSNESEAIEMGMTVPGRTEYDDYDMSLDFHQHRTFTAPTATPTIPTEATKAEVQISIETEALTQKDYACLMKALCSTIAGMNGIWRVEIGHGYELEEN